MLSINNRRSPAFIHKSQLKWHLDSPLVARKVYLYLHNTQFRQKTYNQVELPPKCTGKFIFLWTEGTTCSVGRAP